MYARKIAIITACLALFSAGCSKINSTAEKNQPPVNQEKESVNQSQLSGEWKIAYGGNYGYEFRLQDNYKAIIILYLNEQSIVFKGVWAIEDNNILRANISEIKNVDNANQVNTDSGFTKTRGSKFLFNAELNENGEILILKPLSIVIDSNNSSGFFEPVMKLKKI